MSERFSLKTSRGYDFFEVASALQKEIRRGKEEDALYWAFELSLKFDQYLWSRLKVIVNEDIGIANPNLIVIIDTLSKQYFEFREKGKTSCNLCLANAIMLLCRSEKTRVADHIQGIVVQSYTQGLERKDIPDYALDKHTKRGRNMGRGLDHFRGEGTKLENESKTIKDIYKDRCFELWKTAKKLEFKNNSVREPEQSPKTLFDEG